MQIGQKCRDLLYGFGTLRRNFLWGKIISLRFLAPLKFYKDILRQKNLNNVRKFGTGIIQYKKCSFILCQKLHFYVLKTVVMKNFIDEKLKVQLKPYFFFKSPSLKICSAAERIQIKFPLRMCQYLNSRIAKFDFWGTSELSYQWVVASKLLKYRYELLLGFIPCFANKIGHQKTNVKKIRVNE